MQKIINKITKEEIDVIRVDFAGSDKEFAYVYFGNNNSAFFNKDHIDNETGKLYNNEFELSFNPFNEVESVQPELMESVEEVKQEYTSPTEDDENKG